MACQLILVVESDEKSRSDFIYINSVLNELYDIRLRNDIKITPVFMGGKGNYKRVSGKIKKFQQAYKRNGKSYVIYCFDTDKYDTNPEEQRILKDEEKYCNDNGFEFVWFCHDIEEVFIGKSVLNSEKTAKAIQYSVRHGIEKVKMGNMKSKVMSKGKSNLLLVLEKYFTEG